MTIQEFAKQHGFVISVEKRSIRKLPRYYACFDKVEVRGGGRLLISEYGDGRTPTEAIRAYAKAISGKLIVFGAYTPERREIKVPELE